MEQSIPLAQFAKLPKITIEPGTCAKVIGTHDGVFHCDEVLACTMLRLLPEYSNAKVIRTRDLDILKTCDIVVDVGGIYDLDSLRFDHHQQTFTESMSTIVEGARWKTKLSSAGLIYAHYGKDVISQVISKNRDDESVQKIYDKMYENFIEEIDAIDNGIPICNCTPAYKISTNLSRQVQLLNPSWRDPNPNPTEAFNKATELVKKEFLNRINYYANDWLGAYEIVAKAVENCCEVDESGKIIELSTGGCPWKDHLFKIEKNLGLENELKFVIYSNKNNVWKVQAVPVSPESFISRTPLLKEWHGLRDKELQEISKIPTAIFVHANGFMGSAAKREDAIEMGRRSMAHDSD